MARLFAVVTVLMCACGDTADDTLLHPGPDRRPDELDGSVGVGPTQSAPAPLGECRPSPDGDDVVSLVPVPKGVTADFAVRGRKPVIAVAPNGDATIVWQSGGSVHARSYRASQWLDVETVSSQDMVTESEQAPKLALLPANGVVVAYLEAPSVAPAGQRVVCARERGSDGAWSKASTLAVSGRGWWQDPQPPPLYELTADSAGNATALVRALRVEEPTVPAAPGGLLALRASAGGRFGEPTLLSETPSSAFHLSSDASAGALALWAEAGTGPAKVATFSQAGWRHSLVPPGYGALRAMPERDGSMSVLGVRLVDGIHRVQTAKRTQDGVWSPAIDIGISSAYMYSAHIVGDETGRALATWSGEAEPRCSVTTGLARRDTNGRWSPAELIPGAPSDRTAVSSTALSRSGHTLIAWQAGQSDSRQPCFGDGALYLSWISPAGTWSRPMLIDAGQSLAQLVVALTPTGRALVAWEHGGLVVARWIDAPP